MHPRRSLHVRWLPAVLLLLSRPLFALPPPLALDCLSCHGEPAAADGAGALSVLDAATIAQALRDYRDGRRAGTVMPRLARPLRDAQIDAVATALGRAP